MPTSSQTYLLPPPPRDAVHIWALSISEHVARLGNLEQLLSSEERGKAARFLRPDDRTRYIIAHGVLRQLLGGYLATEPAGVIFQLNDFGKPFLAPKMKPDELTFNLAHSGDVVVYAVANGRRIGIDVEVLRNDLEIAEIARSQFSADEFRTLEEIDHADRTAAFFRCWSRKEAFVKAIGEGLSHPLKQFSVSFRSGEQAKMIWMASDALAHEHWSISDLSIAAGYACAAVCEGRDIHFELHRWPGGS